MVLGFLVLVATAGHTDLGLMSVQVKEGQIRATPSFLGAITGQLAYGERVEALQQQGDWISVKNRSSQSGWVHQSALTKKQVMLGVGGQGGPSGTTSQEIALAGKGFNAEVESQYRRGHSGADYGSVDRMEAMRVSPAEITQFVKDGALKPSEGGVK
ncbi:MAG: SH3 domain-containing protein [Syntrophobacteraceae bacterium]